MENNINIFDLMDEYLDESDIQEYFEDRFGTSRYDIKEIVDNYYKNKFDLKTLIQEIGKSEVLKIINQIGD